MIDFNVGAWRKAAGKLRPEQLSAAKDLVARTLAQHGLSGGLSGGTPQDAASDNATPLPQGASFAEGSYTCDAGTRGYRTYVPASAKDGASGLVVMLHGCTQTPEDFATGTGMNALAETHGFIVVYPRQSRGDNAQSCWNWFSRGDQSRDRGEAAILAGLTRQTIAAHAIPKDKVFVAGLSAGAAMAVILGGAYPDVFGAVGAHSGLPAGAAKDVPSAFAAMAGQAAESAPRTQPTRTIVFHGSADATVHPSNGDRIVQQALDGSAGQSLQTEDGGSAGGKSYRRVTTHGPEGQDMVAHWTIDGMGHAWSGGQPAGSYTDPQGPDASTEMVRFFGFDHDVR